MTMESLSPKQVQEGSSAYHLIDIREKYEYDLGNVGCSNIPMGEFCSRLSELPMDKTIVLMCRSGKRAAALANFLKIDHGMSNVAILEGGIEQWKAVLDTTIKLD